MNRRLHWSRLLGCLAGCAAVVGLWLVFAPAQLGGSVNYAVIDGSSMQPHLHRGDLVVIRAQGAYQTGEVVAYHNPQLGRVVLHRIIGQSGGRYLFRGDNNNFTDFYRPVSSELIGRLWLRVPAAGNALIWLRAPYHGGLVAGVLAILLLGGGGARARRRRKPRAQIVQPALAPARPERSAFLSGASRFVLVLALAGSAVFGLVAALGYTHPSVRIESTPGAYSQQGAYSYSARVSPDSVYPSGRVATGETMFARLVHRLRVGFDYRFVSALRSHVTGAASLSVSLQSSSGWHRSIIASRPEAILGNHASLSLPLDLAGLEKQIGRYYRETGVPNDSFTVAVAPQIDVHGTVAGHAIRDTFAVQPLTFVLDNYSLRLADSILASQAPGQATSDPLHPSVSGVLPRSRTNAIVLLGYRPRVTTLRRIGREGLLASLIAALLATALVAWFGRSDELARIRRQYGHAIIPVSNAPTPPASGYVEVTNIDSLAQLAASFERVILHHQHPDGHGFYIDDNGSVYRYQLTTALRSHQPAGAPATATPLAR